MQRPLQVRTSSSAAPRWTTVALSSFFAATLAACSQAPTARSDAVADAAPTAKRYPPGTAAALSINSAASLPSSDPFQIAMTCVAALQVTSQFLEGRSAELPPGTIDALRKAGSYFHDKVLSESRVAGAQVVNPAAMIQQRVEQAQEQPAAQIRIAMACLKTISST